MNDGFLWKKYVNTLDLAVHRKKMVISYGMPAYKFDRKWKFKISEVDAWMHEKNCISYSEREVNIDVKNN